MLAIVPQQPKVAMFLKQANTRRLTNLDKRPREHLVAHEIEALRKAARSNSRNPHRDDILILLMATHGLRVREAVNLKWSMVDLKIGLLHCTRVKNGLPSTHPLRGIEIRGLRQLRRENPDALHVFLSERKAPLSIRTAHRIISEAGKIANIGFSVHPHMLRHHVGFHLANAGHDIRTIQVYLGHSNIKNTVRYCQLSAKRFQNFWQD